MPRPAVVGLAVAGSAVVLVGLLLVALFAGSKQKQRDIKTTRAYYLSVDEVKWDYAPAPDNACQGRPFDDREAIYARSGPGRIGSIYKKAVFRGYADGTFTKSLTHPPHLGIVGPPVHVEVGDTFKVVLRNNAKFGGVNFAPDNVSPVEGFANPEEVASGDTAIFAFQVSPESGPSDGANASSVMHFYSSSVDRASALYAGLLGPLIVTRKGEADADGRPTDVDDELVTVLFISDENASPYMDTDNKFEAGDGGGDVPSDVVEQSNQMHSVNGMVFCNLPGLDMKMGKRTRWYGAAIGNEADLHTLHWHGNVGSSSDGLHTDSVRLLSHSVYPIDFAPQNPGRWLGHCHVGAHLEHAGMLFLYNVAGESAAPSQSLTKPPTRVREYFIQAEDTVWDYAPQGSNVCDKKPFGFQESIFVEQDYPIMGELESDEGRVIGYGVGSSYVKSHYVQYTDDTFSTAVERTDAEAHLGLMGPVLRVRVGEAIKVHFRNNCSDVITMHTHGLFYLKDSEGAPYSDGSSGADKVDDKVAPGEKVDLLWRAVETSGPGPGESADTKLWIYHGHKGEVADSYAGLFGAVLVVAEAATSYDDETLLPTDGSDEMFLYFSVMNEGGSFHLGENIDRVDRNKRLSDAVVDELKLNGEFQESNLMHSINGFMYCNSRPLKKLTVGKPVRLYLYSLGSDVDFHSISLGNEPLHINGGTTRGTAKLLAGTFTSAVAVPLHSGRLELRCSIDDHIAAGMRMLVDVAPGAPKNDTASAAPSNSTSTTHYIAADKLDWNYARYGKNLCTGDDFGDDEAVFTAAGPDRPGPRYVKARYSAYEDATFRVRKESGRSDFFGIVGPMLHFEVGDTVTVVFRNNLPFAANLNIVGLEELKTSLRSFADGVKPGAEATYTWTVPESSGPGPADLSSVSYVYYSSVNATVHAYAGLTGAISVSAPGGLDRDTGFPKDVDVVVPLLFNIFRENDSPFIAESLDKYATGTVSEKELVELQEDDGWLESNTMHAANGFMYCNNPVMEFAKGARVRWIVFGYGSESSMHSPFFDSDAIVGRSRGGAGVQIFPYTAETVDVVMATPGETSVGCVVVDHRAGGMFVRIRTV